MSVGDILNKKASLKKIESEKGAIDLALSFEEQKDIDALTKMK